MIDPVWPITLTRAESVVSATVDEQIESAEENTIFFWRRTFLQHIDSSIDVCCCHDVDTNQIRKSIINLVFDK